MTSWYFAYGSNMNEKRMQARGINYIQCQSASLEHYQLSFNKRATGKTGIGYANIQYKRHALVQGVAYELPCKDTISLLDPFEGTPVRYSRDIFLLKTASGPLPAWVYVANPAMRDNNLLPEERYLDHLLAGKGFYSEDYHSWLASHEYVPQEPLDDLEKGLTHNV